MASIIPGYEYDIFISYRQKDNKYDGWVTEFVANLKRELEATFKEEINVYFDINPHDGLLETHDVDKSLKDKLKCLIIIPIISQTYCDPKSFAWQHEFCVFNKMVKEDQFGRDIKLRGGNVASRILPVKINDLDPEDYALLEKELGGMLRAVEFIFKSPGVNRPLRANEDHPQDNLNNTYYRDQINKVANAIKEIIKGLIDPGATAPARRKETTRTDTVRKKYPWKKITVPAAIVAFILIAGIFLLPPLLKKLPNYLTSVEKSIAVLPFSNLSNDPEQEYFVEGMHDEILDRLFKIGDLKVISRTSSMRYKDSDLSLKEIARELGVASILEGSVRKIGNNVRITVQLIDAKSDTHLWSQVFDKDISDIFSIQSEVAQSIARELKAVITPQEKARIEKSHTASSEAYEAYLKGMYSWKKLSRADLDIAMQYFELALEIDPEFALAWAGVAHVWTGRRQIRITLPTEATTKGEEAILKALELDTANAEIYYVLATHLVWGKYDWEGGEAAFRRALEINPRHAEALAYYSHLLNILGRTDEAMVQIEKALEVDPLSSLIWALYEVDLTFARRYEEALAAAERKLELDPNLRIGTGIPYLLYFLGKEEEAFREWRKPFSIPDNLKAMDEGYAEGGFREAHRRLADVQAERAKNIFIPPLRIAENYAFAGDTDNAIPWLEKAYEMRDPNLPYLLGPTYDLLRDDPGFQDLCRRMNLPYK